jgi:hypothetical protein
MNRPESALSDDTIKSPPLVISEQEREREQEQEQGQEQGQVQVQEEVPVAVEQAPFDEADMIDPSIQVASSVPDEMGTGDDAAMTFVQLGDYILIESQKYHGRTQGTVYYRSLDRLRVKPDGVSDLLHDFDLIQTEEEELYADEDGVTAVYIIRKRPFESFVEQQDFQVGQVVDALKEDGSDPVSYRITKVNREEDAITLQEAEDAESERTLSFGFVGIPPEEGIRILSIREFVGPEDKNAPNNAPSDAVPQVQNENGPNEYEAEDEDEEPEFNEEQNKLNRLEMLGTVEIVMPTQYREAASFEQRIPDHLQKVDALNDFINSLDPTLQKDPRALREIRIHVETLYQLNKETMEYNEEGEVVGPKAASLQTLSELVTKAAVPMGRPVLRVSKRLYAADDEEEEDTDQTFMKSFYPELDQMIQNSNPLVASVMSGPSGSKTIVREWLQQQLFAKQFRPWVSDSSLVPLWSPYMDTEFFRSEPPETRKISEGVYALLPTIAGYVATHSEDDPPILDDIPFGIERVLGATYRKGTAERKKQLLHPAEEAPLDSYLLFPQQAIPYLGKKRSYHLAMDSGRSQLPMKTMQTLLEELGEPVDRRSSSNNIILLKAVGGELGTIPLKSYIAGLHIHALGWGDVFQTLVHYGIDQYELYPALYRVLQEKITLSQDQVLSALATLRQALSLLDKEQEGQEGREDKEQEKTANELLPSASMWNTIASQEVLARTVEEYQQRNPTLAQSDIGKTLYLTQHYDNFFQVTAAKNPVLIAKAVLEVYNREYIDALRIQSRLRQLEREAGERPKKNKCPHVADMVSVRRLTDDAERFHGLTNVFKRYQGERKDNWFHCNLCKEHLLCIHERLQLQAFLHPREKDVLEKEIILKCSGGQFQGKYICRNCGQAIRDLDFDNNMEFDDDGKPMSGRAVLEDDDALLEERVEDLLKTDADVSEATHWKMTMEEKKCYDVARILSERVGVFMDQVGYQTVIQRTLQYLNKLAPRHVYAKLKGVPFDYDTYHARHFIAYCSIFVLIEIQTKMPEYVVRYRLQGCKSTGFDGYPLDTDPAKRTGIEYIACAVSSIRLQEAPWKNTGYMKEKDDVKRMNAVIYYMTLLFPKALEDATIQAGLGEKRRYLAEVMGRATVGSDNIPRDMVFPTFLPDLKTPSPAEAAANAITPEIAEKMGARGRQALIQLWIRRAHQFASESMAVVRGSPYLETTCCVSSLSTPQQAWASVEDMPPLARRIWTPHVQGAALVTHFHPRPQDLSVAEADKELFYRIFLKYCFQGQRIGHAHEVNLTNRCIWCGFQFPSHPTLMDMEKEGKPALQGQEVVTDTGAFTALLDSIHTVHEVIPAPLPHRTGFAEVMAEFGAMDPPPMDQWSTLMEHTMDALLRIPMNGVNSEETKGDILVALGPLSDAARQNEELFRQRFHPKLVAIADEIVKLPWVSFFQVLQTYFVTLFQRVLSGFSTTSLFLPIELRQTLSSQHVDDLQGMMKTHLSGLLHIYTPLEDNPLLGLAKAKLEYYTAQMAEIFRFRDKIRTMTLPGRTYTLEYLQRILFYGPLSILVDSLHIPEQAQIQSAVQEVNNPSIDYLLRLIRTSLETYTKERLSYNEEKIKTMIAIQAEKERVHVVKEFDKMTDEERAVEKMNKKLGIGKWAVGGSKLIYAYDKDYYDQERLRRLDAGMIDFPGASTGEMLPPDGRMQDEMGFPLYSEAEFERQRYNHAQHGEDD